MMARRGLLGLIAVGAALLLGSCGYLTAREETIRYKMTVEVETPEGVKSGFAVREVTYYEGAGLDKGGISFRGEAVAIGLPNDKTLFALLSAPDSDIDYGPYIYQRVFDWSPDFGDKGEGDFANPEFSHEIVELYPIAPKSSGLVNTNPLPMLVTFGNISDPKSVEQVEPADLVASFGSGYALKRITIQKVNEPVTVGIDKQLPSYGPNSGFDDWYKNLKYGDPRAVSLSDFRRGIK